MEARIITLSEEQKKSIIDEIVKKLDEVVKDPTTMTGDPYDEDEYGHSYDNGRESFGGCLEDLEIDEPRGFPEDMEVLISGKFNGSYSWYDDYDAGDYWTPASGGLEICDAEAHITKLTLEFGEWDDVAKEYHSYEITADEVNEILNEINKRVA